MPRRADRRLDDAERAGRDGEVAGVARRDHEGAARRCAAPGRWWRRGCPWASSAARSSRPTASRSSRRSSCTGRCASPRCRAPPARHGVAEVGVRAVAAEPVVALRHAHAEGHAHRPRAPGASGVREGDAVGGAADRPRLEPAAAGHPEAGDGPARSRRPAARADGAPAVRPVPHPDPVERRSSVLLRNRIVSVPLSVAWLCDQVAANE